jgi:3'-5' exoribonuclease
MKTHPENPGIKNIALGQSFVAFCVLRKKEIKYKQSGEPYLVLELGDSSGRLKARIWDKPLEYARKFEVGNILKIQAIVQVFQDTKEIKIQKIRKVTREDNINLKELLPASTKDEKQLEQQLFQHIKSIKNIHLKELLKLLFEDTAFKKAYCMSPAGKLWHHNYLSGLLEHVVAMLEIAPLMQANYPQIDIDLLKCGIICHDVGKVKEYSLNGFIDFSDQGRLLGHVAMGFEIVSKKIDRVKNFPEELRTQLLHLILSHQSEGKDGEGVVPMTLEAIVLRYLILLDANTNALCRIRQNDALPGSKWSKYIPLLERFIYVGEKSEHHKDENDETEM